MGGDMRGTLTSAAILLSALALAGCVSDSLGSRNSGDFEVRGWDSHTWTDGKTGTARNFRCAYETTAWRDDAEKPFHQMKTELSLSYDPATGTIHEAKITNSLPGYSFRHVCMTPMGEVLRIRLITMLDNRREDLTVVKLYEEQPLSSVCEDYGVGPEDGLVEGFDVIFNPDGTWRIYRGKGAHLTGANIRVVSRMTRDQEGKERLERRYPDESAE